MEGEGRSGAEWWCCLAASQYVHAVWCTLYTVVVLPGCNVVHCGDAAWLLASVCNLVVGVAWLTWLLPCVCILVGGGA